MIGDINLPGKENMRKVTDQAAVMMHGYES